MSKTPTPPKHLLDAGLALWRSILADFEITEQHHLALLAKACEQQDRIASYRESIAATGATVVDRFGQLKPNPLLAEERAASNLLRLLLRELSLDAAVPNESHRLPRGPRYGGAA